MAVQALSQEQITDSYLRQRALQLQEEARQREAAEAAAAAQEAARSRTAGEFGKDVALGLSQGLVGLGGAAYGLANIPFGALNTISGGVIPTPEQITGGRGSQFFQDFQQAMEEGKSAPLQARKIAQEAAFERGIGSGILETVSSGPLLVDLLAQAAPSLIPGTLAARAGGVAGRADAASRGLSAAAQAEQARRKATLAATVATGAQTGGAAYTDVVNAATAEGASPYEANARALGAAALTGVGSAALMGLTGAGALEAGLARVTAGGPAVGGVGRAIATGAGREAAEETAQSALEQEAQNVFIESRALGQDTGKAAALGGIAGGIAGGILGGGVGGLSRALNGGQPSMTREEMATQKAAVDAELDGVLRPSILGGAGQEAGRSAEAQAELAAAQQRAELAAALPTVTPTTDEDMAILRRAFGDEEIDLDAAGLPLEASMPEVQELTGIRRVLAERQIQRAQQPPRAAVTELPVEEIELTDVPAAEVPSVQAAYLRSAPLTGVERRFGEDAAKAEAQRRGVENLRDEDVAKYFGFGELAKAQVRRAQVAPGVVPGEVAPRAAIDVSTKQARAKFAGKVRSELRKAVPMADADKVQGAYVNALADLAASDGIQPGTPEFASFVGRKAYRDMAIANRAGKTDSAEAVQATRLSAAYPISQEEVASIEAGLDFDAAVEQDTAADAAATEPQATVSPAGDVLVPATAVTSTTRGQVWVDPQGGEHTVNMVPNKTTLVMTDPSGKKSTRQLAVLRQQGWSVKGAPAVEGLDAAMLGRLRAALSSTYWQQRGGQLLRERGQEGAVVGRTEWLSSVPEVQAVLSNTGYTAADVSALLDRAATGQGRALTEKQKGLISGVMDALSDAESTTPPVDAQSKTDETLTPQRYDQTRWELYNQYPGAPQLNSLANSKAAEGHPQPVYAGMSRAIDIARDMTELNRAAFAAKAHPEYDLMSDQLRTDIEARIAVAVNRITGAAFNVAPGLVKAPRRQTATEAFKRWFGDSKVVDTAGNPLVVYHGTAADFSEFDPNAGSFGNVGLYFTASPAYANASAELAASGGYSALAKAGGFDAAVEQAQAAGTRGAPSVIPAYLKMERPFDMRKEPGIVRRALAVVGVGAARARQDAALREDLPLNAMYIDNAARDAIAAAGYDGVITENGVYIVFRPTQIKSAVGNVGTFDPASPDIRFNQGDVIGSGVVSKPVFDQTVAEMAQSLGIEIMAHETVADMEAAHGAMPSNVKGMYTTDGVVHIVRANHTSKRDLAFTIAHERGHKGLAQLLGPNLRAATNRMWANAEMRKRIKAKMADLNYAQDTEEARRASRTLAAEEVLADMLASGEKLNNDIMAKLRSGVRTFFATVLGYRDMIVTNSEVDRLLQDVAQVLNGQPAQNVTVGGADADLWFNIPATAAENNAKFNVAQADLDKLIDAATQEAPAKIAPFSDITRAAGKASVDAAKQVGEKIKGNSLGELYIKNAMHLSQLEGWFDKLFEGRIGKLATLKRAKEAFFNQMNSRPIDLQYEGASVGKESVNDIAQAWSKFGRQNPQKMQALNAMTSYGTFYKVFPDRTWEQQNDVDYEAAGFTIEQRREAHQKLQGLWKAVGPDGQAIYKKAQAVYAHRWNQRFETLLAELDRIGKAYTVEKTATDGTVETLARYKNDVRLAMQRVSEGPYSPLQRNGEFIVTARDGDGDVVHFSAYDTKAEAELARKHVRESMERSGDTGVVAVTTQKQFDVNINGTSRGTIEQMSNNVKNDLLMALPAEMSDADKRQVVNSVSAGLVESYLQALPQNAFMKHARKRKNVEGFSTDAFRAFNDYALRSARDTAGIKFDGQIGNAMTQVQGYAKDVTDGKYLPEGVEGVQEVDATKLQNVANAVQSQHAASLDVNRNAFVRTLTQAGFIYYMTSLSQMFLNATQTYMVAFPRLAAQYGAGMAIKELNKAVGQYFKSGFDLLGEGSKIDDPRVKDALQALYEAGTLDFTQAHDLSEMAAGNNETLSPHLSAGIRVLSYAMHKSEVFNRQVTATAAIRMELAKRGNPMPRAGSPEAARLQADMAEVGRKAVDNTHFDYSQSNKPPIMQSNLGALALQFQQYRFHMLSMIGKDIRDGFFGDDAETKAEARKALSWLLGMQLAFTGAAGTILAPIAFAIADAFKDDDDLTDSRQDFINYFGKYAAHGILADVIDTQRIGADTLVPILGQRAYEPITDKQSDILLYHIQQNLGPWVGLAGDAFDGVSHLLNGDVYKASQELLPKPFKDATKAVYEGVNGASDARGIVYHQPSLLSGLSQAVGLRSGERRDAEAVRSAAFRANGRYYAAKERNLNRLAISYSMGDNAAIAQAQADIAAFNEKYPDLAIRGQDMRRAIVNRFRSEQVAAESGVVSGRPLRDSILAATGQ